MGFLFCYINLKCFAKLVVYLYGELVIMVVCNAETYSNGQIGEVVGISRDGVEVQINKKVCKIKLKNNRKFVR